MRECAGEREGEWRPRCRLGTGEPARAPLPSPASWWPREGGGVGRGSGWDGPGRGMVGEGAFPAAAPSAAIGLVAFRDELSRIGFQLQPPGRPGRRGAGGGGEGGGGGGGCSIQAGRGGRRAPRTKAPSPWGGPGAPRSPRPGPSSSRGLCPGRGGGRRVRRGPAADARPVSPELGTRLPPGRAQSFGAARARASA